VFGGGEFEPGFMNQRSGLQGLARRFSCQPRCRQPAQFIINQRQEFRGCLGIASLRAFEDAGHITHCHKVGNNPMLQQGRCSAFRQGSLPSAPGKAGVKLTNKQADSNGVPVEGQCRPEHHRY
jgi:hypothetical protein